MGNDEGLIRIYTEGGIINDVLGLPDDARYKIVDYDDITHMEPCCGNCKHAEACKLGFGDTGCDYEHCRQKELEAEQLKRKILEGEVETYNQYLTGDVYGFILEKPDGEHIDSCWGFYGDNIETNGILDNIGQSYQDLVNSLEDV